MVSLLIESRRWEDSVVGVVKVRFKSLTGLSADGWPNGTIGCEAVNLIQMGDEVWTPPELRVTHFTVVRKDVEMMSSEVVLEVPQLGVGGPLSQLVDAAIHVRANVTYSTACVFDKCGSRPLSFRIINSNWIRGRVEVVVIQPPGLVEVGVV